MDSWSELLDQWEPALKIDIPQPNESWFNKTERLPVFQIADSWGGHEDLPLGLDLSEVA